MSKLSIRDEAPIRRTKCAEMWQEGGRVGYCNGRVRPPSTRDVETGAVGRGGFDSQGYVMEKALRETRHTGTRPLLTSDGGYLGGECGCETANCAGGRPRKRMARRKLCGDAGDGADLRDGGQCCTGRSRARIVCAECRYQDRGEKVAACLLRARVTRDVLLMLLTITSR